VFRAATDGRIWVLKRAFSLLSQKELLGSVHNDRKADYKSQTHAEYWIKALETDAFCSSSALSRLVDRSAFQIAYDKSDGSGRSGSAVAIILGATALCLCFDVNVTLGN
jgi:hypothetical protein